MRKFAIGSTAVGGPANLSHLIGGRTKVWVNHKLSKVTTGLASPGVATIVSPLAKGVGG